MPNDEPAILTTVANEIQAAPLVAALAEAGIEAQTVGGFSADFRNGVPVRVEIVVRDSDLVAARDILEEWDDNTTDVDWSQVDIGQPEDPSNS